MVAPDTVRPLRWRLEEGSGTRGRGGVAGAAGWGQGSDERRGPVVRKSPGTPVGVGAARPWDPEDLRPPRPAPSHPQSSRSPRPPHPPVGDAPGRQTRVRPAPLSGAYGRPRPRSASSRRPPSSDRGGGGPRRAPVNNERNVERGKKCEPIFTSKT